VRLALGPKLSGFVKWSFSDGVNLPNGSDTWTVTETHNCSLFFVFFFFFFLLKDRRRDQPLLFYLSVIIIALICYEPYKKVLDDRNDMCSFKFN
jgi:hypothetical protein